MQMGPSVQEDKKAHSLEGIRQDWGEKKKSRLNKKKEDGERKKERTALKKKAK